MSKVIELKDSKIAGKTLFLDVSVRVVLEAFGSVD